MRWPTLARTCLSVAATAVVGGLGTDPASAWYRDLDKPSWQPPPPAYGLVWTPLYADLAVICALSLDRLTGVERRRYGRALAANLVLNAGWNWLFFKARRPWLAAAECAVLTVSSADLVRRVGRSDPRSAVALAPYALWCGFATTLTVALARRNPSPGRRASAVPEA